MNDLLSILCILYACVSIFSSMLSVIFCSFKTCLFTFFVPVGNKFVTTNISRHIAANSDNISEPKCSASIVGIAIRRIPINVSISNPVIVTVGAVSLSVM